MSDTRPRVFHLITRLLKGGAEGVVLDIALGLEDYQFTVGCGASYDDDQLAHLHENGVDTEVFSLIRHYNPVTGVPAVLSVANYLQNHEFDIVHTHSTEAGIIGRFAASLAGVPNVVHTVHGVPFTDDRNTLLNRFVLGCERSAASRTDRILTNADVIADEYLERGIGSPEQYTTVYIGTDLETFQDAEPATDLPGSRPRVVMIGRLAEGKGFDILLDSVASMSHENLSVCLVGDGPLRESLAEQIRNRGLSDTVFLTGFRTDIPNVLAASDILVLPSFREGTPRVITEAMASGLPVVATDIAGIPEQVENGETGYLIPTGDPNALADRLEELLANSELRAQMGARGADRAKQFSTDAMLDDVAAAYDTLLKDPN
ncbi:glycosyltransferase family 4 protein [Haloarcula nitratireducens]|uniref:Glycosyltransferase family 4 protein n=1 Tax=Haloarcula nitratireducens TaxID=2487749 RepID=A0AAW4PFH8_9EURY|nr:glycosyltransferase family 4 protein [Halomicroarcula nitratireducens]MBX0296641.1 glycosyltransferase family 4 protein [Halomicroarcula nitratireducens]